MTVWEKVNNNLKKAMKARNEFTVSVLRMFSAAIKNKKIELIGAGEENLSDEQVIAVAATEIKKRNDAIVAYEQGGRQDLADKEKKEIEILSSYMPAQASDEEITKIVSEIIGAAGENKNFGQVMGQAMRELKGKADGNQVAEIVKKLLAQ